MKDITFIIQKTPKRYDADDVLFTVDGEKFHKKGYRGKKKGRPVCLIYCPNCERENYIMTVSSGFCAWCGYNPNTGHIPVETGEKLAN